MGTHFTLSIAQKASQGEYSLSKGTCGNCDAVKKKQRKTWHNNLRLSSLLVQYTTSTITMMMKTTPPITPPIMAPVFLLLVDGVDVGARNKMIIHQT